MTGGPAALKRITWVPRVEDGDSDGATSKIGGKAWLAPGEAWPTCPNCSQPLQLVVQLATEELPEEYRTRFGTGLVQHVHRDG